MPWSVGPVLCAGPNVLNDVLPRPALYPPEGAAAADAAVIEPQLIAELEARLTRSKTV